MAAADEEPKSLPPKLVNTLASRLSTLPIILAGPILRHVDSHSVTVWFALRHPKQVKLQVFDSKIVGVRFESALATTVRVGTNLHLVAVTARAPDAAHELVPGRIYTYNVQFTAVAGADPTTGDLFTKGFLVPVQSTADPASMISYGGLGQPSFALPPADLLNLRIVHGSCRKPHAQGV